MRNYTFRLKSGQDLFDSIQAFAAEKQIEAGCVLSGVGSLTHAALRLANREFISEYEAILRSSRSPVQFPSMARICISRFRIRTAKRSAGILNQAAKSTRPQKLSLRSLAMLSTSASLQKIPGMMN